MRLLRVGVHGALVVLVACGSRAPASVQRAQPALTASATAATSSTPTSGVANYACPPAPSSALTVVPQGGLTVVGELHVSKDGRIAAVKATSTEVQIWNLATETKVSSLVTPGVIERMALHPDGRALAFSSEGHVQVKDLEKGSVTPISTPGRDISGVDFSRDGKQIFITRAIQVDVVDAANASARASITTLAIYGGISPDGRWIVGRDGSLWDVRANQVKWRMRPPSAVAFSEDGQTLAYGIGDKTIAVVDAATGARRWEVSLTGSRSGDISISPDGQSVATYDVGRMKDPRGRGEPIDKGIALFHRGKRVRVASARDARGTKATFSPDGTRLAFVTPSGSEYQIRIVDVATGKLAQPSSTPPTGELRADAPRWTNDNKTIVQAGAASLYVFDTAKGGRKIIGKSPGDITFNGTRDAVWSADDSALLVLAESSDRQALRSIATILDLKTGATREALDSKTSTRSPDYIQRFKAAEWAPNGLLLLTRGDGVVVWDGRSPAPLRILDESLTQSEERIIAVSPRGDLAATMVASQKEVRLWEPKTGTRKGVLAVDNGAIEAAAFTADSARIALAADVISGSDRSAQIFIYDAQTGGLQKTLKGPLRRSAFGKGSTIHWTPQARALVAVDQQGNIALWNAMADEDPPIPLVTRAAAGPSALGDGGNVLVMGRTSVDVWDLRTRTRARELPGDGSTVDHIRMNHAGTVAAIARGDHIDLLRLSDGAHLTIRPTPIWQPNQTAFIHADDGTFAGARNAFQTLRIRENENQLEARAMKQDEATALFRPTLALDFVAGCPMPTSSPASN